MYRVVLFDLDGTLTRSDKGILRSVAYALERMGIREQDRTKLMRFIGPSLYDSFTRFYGFNDKDAREAVVYYRELYEKEGIYESPPYEGIPELLKGLSGEGVRCYVVTSKPQEMAERVAEYHDIRKYFEGVVGPGRGGTSSDKTVLIGRALEEAGISGNSHTAKALMVGDRKYDIEGAKNAGIDSAGVLYGYGTREELEGAGASFLAETPDAIYRIVKEED